MRTVHKSGEGLPLLELGGILFWDGASPVLAEKLNNVAHVCVGIAVKQEIALEKKENQS